MERKECYDKKGRKLLREQLYITQIPSEFRKNLWFLTSGAKLKQEMDPDYYSNLKQCYENYPKYFEAPIEKDLMRTFPEKPYDPKEEKIVKMRAILTHYAIRNPTIGYCQGLNFLVARIVDIIEDEEEAFWILCAVLEDILPIDYFTSMVGVLVDQKIFSEMVYSFDKELGRKFANLEVDPSLFSLQWFVCCFVSTFSRKLAEVVWDLLFLEGTNILFKAGLVFLQYLKPKIMQVKDFTEIFKIIEENGSFAEDTREFTKKLHQIYISSKLVQIMRKQYQWIIEEELQSLENKKKVRVQVHKDFVPPSCKPEWPICLDHFEKAKQKKRNSSSFGLRIQNITSKKASYLTIEYRAAHPNKNPLLKKKLENKTRGRDRITRYEDGRGRVRLMESKKFSKDSLSPLSSDRGSNNELSPTADPIDTSVEMKRNSEKIIAMQNYLVIGRTEHSCKEGLIAKNNKPNKEEEVSRTDSFEIKEIEPLPQKKPITRPSARTAIRRPPQIVYQQPNKNNMESSPEISDINTPSPLKGLFGTGNIKRMPASPQESREDPKDLQEKDTISLPPTNVSFSSEFNPQNPQKKDSIDFEEEEIVRKKPRKTIYNYLMETNFEDEDEQNNNDNGRKSVMFMKHFFKGER